MAELHGHLKLLDYPAFVALNETKLDSSTPDSEVKLENYTLVARRDRPEENKPKRRKKRLATGCGGGGVALYARTDCTTSVVLLEHSTTHERTWLTVHTTQGPLLLGVWYRPPGPETASVETLEEEWLRLSEGAVGTLLVGDLNVHHLRWLTHSSTATPTTPAGKELCSFCAAHGLKERVGALTRGEHLLDLVLTDFPEAVHCTVQPMLADHSLVLARVLLEVPKEVTVERERWLFDKANWKALKAELTETSWNRIFFHKADGLKPEECTAEATDLAVERFTEYLLKTARKHVPVTTWKEKKSSHPWLDDHCLALVQAKRQAGGTPEYEQKLKECSEGILHAYQEYAKRTRAKMSSLPRGSKKLSLSFFDYF